MSKLNNNQAVNNQSGGSYIKDPVTGERELVEQTKQQKVTRLNEQKATEKSVNKQAQKSVSKKSKTETHAKGDKK